MGPALSTAFIEPSTLPEGAGGALQLLFLLAAYAYILYFSSGLISEGSELLLLVPSLAGIVGSVVLPVLGAVPDGAIVLFSGLGPIDQAQEQLNVGVGALAGSTIMLLTLPWALSVFAGRVNLSADGSGNYKPRKGHAKLEPAGNASLRGTGVNVAGSIAVGGKIMIATALGYVIIQAPAFGLGCGKKVDPHCDGSGEKWWAFAGLLYCVAAFVGYLWYQVKTSGDDKTRQDKVDQLRAAAISKGDLTLTGAFAEALLGGGPGRSAYSGGSGGGATAATGLLPGGRAQTPDERFRSTLKTFFHKYDVNGDKEIDKHELNALLVDMGERVTKAELAALMTRMDTDGSGTIGFDEFAVAMRALLEDRAHPRRNTLMNAGHLQQAAAMAAGAESKAEAGEGDGEGDGDGDGDGDGSGDGDGDGDGSGDEEEEVPEDLAHLSPSQQQTRIKLRSAWMMGLGTALVLLFSDPMVDVLSEVGTRTGIPSFYIAFVLAPLASNASELIASYSYALKKTNKTITISLSALEGAGCMNNTFCLALFLLLIWARPGLVWAFSAETLSILLVQVAMLYFALKRTHTLMDALLVCALYPLSIAFVALTEAAGLN